MVDTRILKPPDPRLMAREKAEAESIRKIVPLEAESYITAQRCYSDASKYPRRIGKSKPTTPELEENDIKALIVASRRAEMDTPLSHKDSVIHETSDRQLSSVAGYYATVALCFLFLFALANSPSFFYAFADLFWIIIIVGFCAIVILGLRSLLRRVTRRSSLQAKTRTHDPEAQMNR
jgi:hypothetical protein